MDLVLPFKTGDAAEMRSFTSGFRGAWFRCKISDMCVKPSGHLACYLEYIDFPDEKKTWTRLYQIRPGSRNQKSSESREIMLRPPFPQWYQENQIPEHCLKTDVVAIVSEPWKVGDLIDWWSNDCYWTGKIIELLGDGNVKIVLLEPPFGEGGSYDAECKDLRPALDWSLEKGWSVPLSWANGNSWYTAHLIFQNTDTESSSSDEDIEHSDDDKKEGHKGFNGASAMPQKVLNTSNVKLSSHINSKSFTSNQRDSSGMSMPKPMPTSNKASSPSTMSGEPPLATTNSQSGTNSFRKFQASSTELFSAQPPDTVEDAIMGLESVANKIRWLNDLLQSSGSTTSDAAKPSWKLLEKDKSAEQK